jgi:hypothetical protein
LIRTGVGQNPAACGTNQGNWERRPPPLRYTAPSLNRKRRFAPSLVDRCTQVGFSG